MTMPDLGTYQIKRSYNPVRYLYVYHSINSTHMASRRGAFDNYNEILCVTPHHTEEIRAAEESYGLEPRILLEGGYVILDSIIASAQNFIATPYDGPRRILIAPSWRDEGLFESVGMVAVLLEAGYQVTVRPHIMTIRGQHSTLPPDAGAVQIQSWFSNVSGSLVPGDGCGYHDRRLVGSGY